MESKNKLKSQSKMSRNLFQSQNTMESELQFSKSQLEDLNSTQDPMVQFLFDISNEVKVFYETPVIFLTKKDYSDIIFNTMCDIRKVFQETTKEDKTAMIDSIVDFHLEWLHAVVDIENFLKLIPNLPREEVYMAISYTIDAMGSRLKYYQRYMEKYRPSLANEEQANLAADLEIVEEMHKDVTEVLLEKLKCFRNFVDHQEFQIKVRDAAEELLLWLDKINDGLAMHLSKYINLNVPQLTGDLTKALQQIVDELHTSSSETAQKVLEDLKQRGKELSSMIRCTADRSLEISKVEEKISVLDDRIQRLEEIPTSAALMALQHKKQFLERRLISLENLKSSLKDLKDTPICQFDEAAEDELCVCEDFYHMRIFNHSLPLEERERLVTELCYLWNLAVFGEKTEKSIISILSAAEAREEFTDELGTFYFDENGRKIYRLPEDTTLYQANELNELVPLSDDADHIYFFDECGRYFIDPKTRQRVYKAHSSASEYMMDTTGVLLKVKEERDGITFFYDSYGRYYINDEGKHVYREADAASEYENDGLGNLVRVRSRADLFDLCPLDVNVTEDFNYLKLNVGQALRECIADCILRQPADPIKFLSCRLLKYRENLELRDKMAAERQELEAERENIREQERLAAERKAAMEAALHDEAGSEASYDSNLVNYATFDVEASATPSPSSKMK